MRDAILCKLREIEKAENVRILLAVESGSRAWGFASPDSDYDVRFVYARPQRDYLRLEKTRDVIEFPIDGVLDINGWDLSKALRLLYRSNPTLFEWISSPIVYLDSGFRKRIAPLLPAYFSPKRGLYHYLSMAKVNSRKFLQGEAVKAKKYFYGLRPLLACRWILERGTQPPMLFSALVSAELESSLMPDVQRLLELKMNASEQEALAKIELMGDYIERSIEDIEQRIKELPEEPLNDWTPLNEFFLSELKNIE